VSDPRNALLEKFRANLCARVQKLRDMLEILKQIPDNPEAISQVSGELHTLKGEARLLGLVRLSELAHTLETVLSHIDAQAIAAAEIGFDAMARALMVQVTREDADALLTTTIERIEGRSEPLESPAPVEAVGAGGDSPPEAPIPAALGASERWVQVDASHIDELCDTMAAISGDFGRIFAQVNHLATTAGDASSRSNLRQQGSLLIEECTRFRSALNNATVRTWELRMVPAQPLLRELAAHARQLALGAGKIVVVNVDAAGVQIERDALDKIWDAMIHLVRNSIDHGLELAAERGSKGATGNLTISARTVGTSVTLTISDDGRGIDTERVRHVAIAQRLLDPGQAEALRDDEVIQLVFERGFSTSEKVSSLSGRGIGLDVVKSRVESLGGRVEVHSQKGVGTRFSITLPFTLTKERLMVFEFAGGLYGLPTQSIRAVIGWRDLPDATDGVDGVVRVEGDPVPLRSLAELLGRESEPCSAALIVSLQEQLYGLLVARVVGERELIRRPAEPLLARTTAIGASAMMEDGRAVLMLDLIQVGRRIRHGAGGGDAAPSRLAHNTISKVLLVDDSPVIRDMVSEILASAGLMVTTANDGEDALRQISEGEPDLVVSDIEMPRMDGFTLLEQIRKRSQRLPVVMLTTRASAQDRQRATTLGANAYVLKADFKSDVLLDVVQRFVPLHR
jgi:two-component system, chemotaxis family, sensor kinase CheA